MEIRVNVPDEVTAEAKRRGLPVETQGYAEGDGGARRVIWSLVWIPASKIFSGLAFLPVEKWLK